MLVAATSSCWIQAIPGYTFRNIRQPRAIVITVSYSPIPVLNDKMAIPGESITILRVSNWTVSRNLSVRKIPPRRDHDCDCQKISQAKIAFSFSPWPVPMYLPTINQRSSNCEVTIFVRNRQLVISFCSHFWPRSLQIGDELSFLIGAISASVSRYECLLKGRQLVTFHHRSNFSEWIWRLWKGCRSLQRFVRPKAWSKICTGESDKVVLT
jgi:hypothetical protein